MAGFLNRIQNSYNNNNISDFIKDLSTLGVNYRKELAKQTKSVGYNEKDLHSAGKWLYSDSDDDYGLFLQASLMDINSNKSIAFYDQDFTKKREELRKIAIQEEIEEILDIICDETIVYNEKNMFCSPADINISIKDRDGFIDYLNATFKKIYRLFQFQNDQTAWWYFRQFLIDGYLSFEIIYSEDNKNIIGFKNIDPASLQPAIDNEGRAIWYQYKNDARNERILHDSQVIYISYASSSKTTRDSYVERLVRPFNILRIMENTRIIWAVVNAQFRTTFVVPMGGKSKNKAKESLAKLMQQYNERVDFDAESGNLNVNGSPNMPFYKQYWFPEKDGSRPTIENLGGDGPDLSDTAIVNYFKDKLKNVSKVPFQRFDKDSGGGAMEFGAEGIIRQEYRFSRFIDRIRAVFSEIIQKPLLQQILLDYPAYKDDEALISEIQIQFNKNNLFEEFKEQDILEKRANFISTLQGIQDEEGESYFASEFLVEKFMKMDKNDIQRNAEIKTRNKSSDYDDLD